MALPDTIKIVPGTALVFSHTSEYVPTAGQIAGTDADIDWNDSTTGTGIASGVCWQSVKLDLGSANLDVEWDVTANMEFFSAPTAGGVVKFYLSFSSSATAGNDNAGNASGAEGIYQGYGTDSASGIEALPQLHYIGSLVVTNDADLHVGNLGTFTPEKRYASLVVYNNTSVAIAATDAIETSLVITPLQHQLQD